MALVPINNNNNNTNDASDVDRIERPSRSGEHYELIRKLGEGSFGVIYLGKSDLTPDLIAIKFESRKSTAPQLRDEYRAYKYLNTSITSTHLRESGDPDEVELSKGIPRVYHFSHDAIFNYLILDWLGPSLEELFDRCGRRFSVKSVCFLAHEMITRVQTIHRFGLIYRDIKPDNFLLGKGDQQHYHADRNTVYVVDFGMAKHYRDPKTLQHIPYREKKSLSGTARYMSINTHLGREQSRRDDMEALGNVFMYFLRGSLPWQGLKARDNREKYEKIGQRKQLIRVEELCAGYPAQFAWYVASVRRLNFEEEPAYEEYKKWFKNVLETYDPDEPFDWDKFRVQDSSRNRNNIPAAVTGDIGTGGGGAGHYEPPKSTPNHLSNFGRTDRNAVVSLGGGGGGGGGESTLNNNKQSTGLVMVPSLPQPKITTTGSWHQSQQQQPQFSPLTSPLGGGLRTPKDSSTPKMTTLSNRENGGEIIGISRSNQQQQQQQQKNKSVWRKLFCF